MRDTFLSEKLRHTIHQLLVKLDLPTKQINQVNQFRLKVGNPVI